MYFQCPGQYMVGTLSMSLQCISSVPAWYTTLCPQWEEEEARRREEERRRAEQAERERREREEAARCEAEKQRREAEARRRAEEMTEDAEDEDMGVESEIGGTSQVAKGKRRATAERQKKRKRVSDTGPASKK